MNPDIVIPRGLHGKPGSKCLIFLIGHSRFVHNLPTCLHPFQCGFSRDNNLERICERRTCGQGVDTQGMDFVGRRQLNCRGNEPFVGIAFCRGPALEGVIVYGPVKQPSVSPGNNPLAYSATILISIDYLAHPEFLFRGMHLENLPVRTNRLRRGFRPAESDFPDAQIPAIDRRSNVYPQIAYAVPACRKIGFERCDILPCGGFRNITLLVHHNSGHSLRIGLISEIYFEIMHIRCTTVLCRSKKTQVQIGIVCIYFHRNEHPVIPATCLPV